MKRIGIVFITACLSVAAFAQPPARLRAAQEAAKTSATDNSRNTPAASQRAQLEFPTQAPMPEDVIWRRDIYRSLDLTKDANAALYYPQEPEGDRMSLFTFLFKLILRGQINAYDYRIDGKEDFSEGNRIKGKDLMDKYHIYYETNDGRIRVNDSDLPSAEVLGYYIKESAYFDQQTATYHTKVTALCPVLKRADDFGEGTTSYPMFWVKYDDISTHLAGLPLMGSNLNNAATLSADDYFTMNRYEGTIYKTNNLQGRVLANYCTTDSALKKEEKRIEKQLADFERHIWGSDSTATAAVSDTTAVNEKDSKSREKKARTTTSSRRRTNDEAKAPKVKTQRSSSPSAPRVSVRRQRH